jgi:pimeloyl-ACP methyl ester carboxylesterase
VTERVTSVRLRWGWCIAALLGTAAGTAASAAPLEPCRLKGVAHEAQCGSVQRPLDPARAQGVAIDVHFAVLPALARNKLSDPVFFIAGGPGQSAIDLAGPLSAQFARLANRRDLVFVDQRGTGRSAPLRCDDDGDALRPLAEAVDEAAQLRRLAECRVRLSALPHGDLRHYGTTLAMADLDAVRAQLGAARINLVAASYGTRAGLEYMRLYPRAVRRVVLDGVAPADMALPASFSADNQAALDALFAGCAADAECRARHPALKEQWLALLASLPREVALTHPYTGIGERVHLTREAVLGMVRTPLYVPALAAGLPQAIAEAAAGRFAPLAGLASALSGPGRPALYSGMHFSVVCTEDLPRLSLAPAPDGAQFGQAFARVYQQACAQWPRGTVDPAFYITPPAPAATWLLSGGDDPATPPRHAARAAQALGAKARHTVVPHGGHGVMALPCLRDAVQRFIDAASDDDALQVSADCAATVPRARVFVPMAGASGPR